MAELFADIWQDLVWIWEPRDAESTMALVGLIGLVLGSILLRKPFGGFIKAFFKLSLLLIVGGWVWSVAPWLLFVLVAFAALVFIEPKSMLWFKRITLALAVIAAIVAAFYNVFGA